MMREERAPEAASICPACKSPVNAEDRFCEKCGEKISPPQPSPPAQASVCRSCGTPLLPNARFCENCGDPVKKEVSAAPSPAGAPTAPPVSGEPSLPRGLIVTEEPVGAANFGVPENSGPVPALEVTVKEGAGPVMGEEPEPEPVLKPKLAEEPAEEWVEEPVQEPETEFEEEPEDESAEEPEEALQEEVAEELRDELEEEPGHIPEEPGPAAILKESCDGPVDELLLGLEPEEPTGPGPDKRPARAATTIPKKAAAATATAPRKPGSSKKPFMVIGLIAAVIVIAIAIVALLPVLNGPGVSGTNVPAVQATPVATPEPTALPAPVVMETPVPAPSVPAVTPAATESPEQVDVLPPQYTLHFEVFKDVVTGDVTVTVTGPSRNVVKDIEVTVFHPDGTTDSDHLLPSQGMTEVTVTGTRSAERVVATVLFYSGEQYKLIDRIVSFSRRT